jgi:hypothetical protein
VNSFLETLTKLPWAYITGGTLATIYAYYWVEYLAKVRRRKRIVRKYPNGFVHDNMVCIPNGDGAVLPESQREKLPQLEECDVELVAALSLVYEAGLGSDVYLYATSDSFADCFDGGL